MQAQNHSGRGDCETLQGGLVFHDSEWLPSRTEDEMTLQVALVAKDGIVLASDTCMLQYHPSLSASQTYSGRKIIDVPAAKVAYAFAGDDCAREAGRLLETTLLTGFDLSRIRDALERVADETYATEKAKLGGRSLLDVNRTLLAVFYRDKPQLWKVQIKDGASRADEVGDFVAGDYGNTARFFKERYWRQNRERRIEELKLLAAHVILMGGTLNPHVIEGLDMAVITPEKGFVRLSDDELSKLAEASAELNHLIESRLFDVAGSGASPLTSDSGPCPPAVRV